jgi:hypothetical protein
LRSYDPAHFIYNHRYLGIDSNYPLPKMTKLILIIALSIGALSSDAQTLPKRKLSDPQKLLWCAYGTTAIAITFHGIHNTQLRKDKLFYQGIGNGALFATGALLITALEIHTSAVRKEKGLTMNISPVGMSLSYRF